jgi:hydroxymethylglutaryl-CoA lyase
MKEFNSDTEFGVHLHSNPSSSKEKIMAAYKSGCRRFDGALLGFGGCPFADDKLVGNIDTLTILEALASNNETSSINIDELNKAKLIASEIFS